LIGAACLARLHAAGHDVVAAGRNLRSARRRLPYAQWIAGDFRKLARAEAWQPLLQGIDAVVNCVGVLQDGLRDDVQLLYDNDEIFTTFLSSVNDEGYNNWINTVGTFPPYYVDAWQYPFALRHKCVRAQLCSPRQGGIKVVIQDGDAILVASWHRHEIEKLLQRAPQGLLSHETARSRAILFRKKIPCSPQD